MADHCPMCAGTGIAPPRRCTRSAGRRGRCVLPVEFLVPQTLKTIRMKESTTFWVGVCAAHATGNTWARRIPAPPPAPEGM